VWDNILIVFITEIIERYFSVFQCLPMREGRPYSHGLPMCFFFVISFKGGEDIFLCVLDRARY